MTATVILHPHDLGLYGWEDWRPGQWEMAYGISEAADPFHLLVAPTGFGKSLTYAAMAVLTGARTVVLTATKALQDQLMVDFEELGWVDVRGQSNYMCAAPDRKPEWSHLFRRGQQYTAAQGPCRWGMRCDLKEGGCPYYDRIRQAARTVKDGGVAITNYDFWLHNRDKLGKVDLLIMDEAHQAPDELNDFLSFRLAKRDLVQAGNFPASDDLKLWQDWSLWAAERLQQRCESMTPPPMELIRLAHSVKRMSELIVAGDWVVEDLGKEFAFDCIDSDRFGQHLWGGVSKVLMVSATINLMTATSLGIDKAKVKRWEAKSRFPIERRRTWAVNGAPQMSFRTADAAKSIWANLIDRIVEARGDRKGIIHTHSFERAKFIQGKSRFSSRMMINDSRSTKDVVAAFRSLPANSGRILLSPSVTTGWDFPGQDCEYQIIAKIPFPDLRTKAAKVRSARNREWAGYDAAQTIVQASGRGMRSADDRCETFIVDGNFGWWYDRNWRYTPRWWQEALDVCEMGKLPPPPPSLCTEGGYHV